MGNSKETLQTAFAMPWTIGYEVRRWLAWPYIRLMFALNGVAWGKRWRIWGMPMIQRYRGSRITLGDGVQLRSWRSTNPLSPVNPVTFSTRTPQALIAIGQDVGMTGTTIVAMERVQIGDRVLIGANTTIVDTDFHPLEPAARQVDILAGEHKPVVIEADVFIGMNVLVLKGVRIGAGAVVGAGSVVLGDVPAGAVAVGNPARLVRALETTHLKEKE